MNKNNTNNPTKFNQDEFSVILERFDRIDSNIEIMKADIGTLKSDVNTLKSDVNILKSDVLTLKADVAVLKSDMSAVKIKLNLTYEKVGELTGDMFVVKRWCNTFSEDIATIKVALKSHDTRLTNLEAR